MDTFEEDDMIPLVGNWGMHKITLPNGVSITKWVLFIGGMEKKDLQDAINSASAEDKDNLINLREHAGYELTSLNISPSQATLLLINLGEQAYRQGNREIWAQYAHAKLKEKSGCLSKLLLLPLMIPFELVSRLKDMFIDK